jgi:hypothetical protein
VILQPTQRGFIEFRVAHHATITGHQRDAMRKGRSGGISQRIRIDAGTPLHCNQPGFTKQFCGRSLSQPAAQPPVEVQNRQDNKDPTNK